MCDELDIKLNVQSLIRPKLPSKKPKLLQTETVGGLGSRVAVRPMTDMEAGNQPRKKAPMVVNAVWTRNERPDVDQVDLVDAPKQVHRKCRIILCNYFPSY